METPVDDTPETQDTPIVEKSLITPEPIVTSVVPGKRHTRSGREIKTPQKYQDFVCDFECFV